MTSILFTSSSVRCTTVIIFLLSKISNISSYTKVPSSSPSPEIWLTSYHETDSYEDKLAEPEYRTLDHFDNQLISKFNRTDYIIQNDIRLAEFTCQAKYPVKWSIPHLKQIEALPHYMFETLFSRLSDFSQEENGAPKNEYFQSVLTIRLEYIEYFFSVNVTCERTDIGRTYMHASSIYLYFSGKHGIENPFTTAQVYVSKDTSSEFILPCRPATPNVNILLEKQIDNPNNSGLKWKRFKYPSIVNFDPKLGFIMDKNPMGKISIIFGLYKCTAILEEGAADEKKKQQEFMYVNVTSVKDPNIIDIENVHFRSNLNLKDDALVKYSQNIFHSTSPISLSLNQSLQSYQDTEFVCCSGKNDTTPIIVLDYCKDHLQCNLLKWLMAIKLQGTGGGYDLTYYSQAQNGYLEGDPKECRSAGLQNSQVVFCEGENVSFANQLVNVFNKNVWPMENRLETWQSNKKQKRMRLCTFEAEDSKLEDMSRKIYLTIGHRITTRHLEEDNGRYYDQLQNLDFGEIRFSLEEYNETPSKELKIRRKALTKKVAEYPRDRFYVGEPLFPICLGWASFYSDGAYVGVNFKNGTKQIINLTKEPVKTELYFAGGLVINDVWEVGWEQFVHKFGKSLVAHKDMVSIDCWMPQWNTERWDKMSKNLTILEPSPPNFFGGVEEPEQYVYFELGDESKELLWAVMGGLPESRVDVTKDGRNILKRLTSNLNREDDDNEEEDPFKEFFNVTLKNYNKTVVWGANGIITVVKVRFARRITHEMQGVYVCTAENVGGKVTRTFRVIVAEKPKTALPILFVATIVAALILIAGMSYRIQKQKRHLLSFRETLS